MKDLVERFEVGEEMGARLRRIRVDAGLSMRQLAVRMGRPNRSYLCRISRIELGESPGVTFGVVMDYLRGCRASIHDVSDVLDRYTSRSVVPEERARAEMADRVDGSRETVDGKSGSRAAAVQS